MLLKEVTLYCGKGANQKVWNESLTKNKQKQAKKLDVGHIDTTYERYKVWLEWEKSEKHPAQMGILLHEDIVLTSLAQPGKVVYGLTLYTASPPKANTVKYKLFETYNGGDNYAQKLTVVRLQRNLSADATVNFIQIPTEEPPIVGKVCGMVSVGRKFNESSEVLAIIKPPDICGNSHKLRDKDLCVGLYEEGKRTHCSYFYDGSPLICNDTLTCISAAIKPCNETKARICMSVFHYSDWIKEAIKRIRKLEDDEDPLEDEDKEKGYDLKPLWILYIFIANMCFMII
uniref:Peptidase S1 domain-containing protein n=1 Tax=Glossina brevipalpis TaxID=37001 RepID=A0A1A9W194_9MUSC